MTTNTITASEIEQLEKFLLWFTAQEEIPAETRRDFIGHILKLGYIDEHSMKFIEKTLEYLEHKSTKAREYWEKDLAMWQSFIAAEKNEETSLRVRDVKEAEKLINEITDKFIEEVKEAEETIRKTEESSEKSREISQVEKLKAALN